MNEIAPQKQSRQGGGSSWPWWLAGGCVLVVVLALLMPREERTSRPTATPATAADEGRTGVETSASGTRARNRQARQLSAEERAKAQEIVAAKLKQFGQMRHKIVEHWARKKKITLTPEVERFFTAVEGGKWEEIEAAYRAMVGEGEKANRPRNDELREIWRPIQEMWGAAEQAHNWPAQRFLEYGNAILDSLRPGMIYAGGTDPGCFIATMLNDTSEGERHIVLTQNALADGTYLEYLDFLYGDQMVTLKPEDSQKSFQDYLSDVQKRAQHDQEFPDEAKQLRPGEDVKITEGRVQVSGQVAVMAINEKLFQALMTKNPGASFAMEESFPFASMSGSASTLGPVMEMGVRDPQAALTQERAAQSVDYWRSAADQLVADPDTPEGSDARKAYSKMISAQAGLLVDRKFTAEAEQDFQIAAQICPESPEVVFRYTNLLLSQNRAAEALPLVENALRADPDNTQFQGLRDQLKNMAGKQTGAAR
jgi:tetratricopeptide (TPR) repeat protein